MVSSMEPGRSCARRCRCGWRAARIAISLILRDEKGNFVFWRSEYVRKPAKGESRAFSIQIYGLPKYASYEAYAYAS